MEDNIYKTRLLLLANFLEQLPNDRFNYGSWVGSNWAGKPDLSCGTTACALGWAATIPQLVEAGLTLIRGEDGEGQICLHSELDMVNDYSAFYTALTAGREVFGLNDNEFEHLFVPLTSLHNEEGDYALAPGPHYHARADEVALHIRNFVAYKFKD